MHQLPLDPPHPLDPPPNLRKLQSQATLHRVSTATGDPAWLVTGYHEVRQLFDDPRLGRSHPDPAQASRIGESMLFNGPIGNFATELEDHARFRARLQPHFSPKRMRELRPRIEQLTASLLDDLAAREPPQDLVTALALPLPVGVICELLGVPYQDRDQFRGWTQAAAATGDRARSEHGLISLYGYGKDLVARKRERPGDDLISRWAADESMTDDQVAVLAMSLLWAGHETTVVAIGMGALRLLTEPGLWQRAAADPVPVVEETLRTLTWAGTPAVRYVREPVEVAGVTIAPGELLLLDNWAANHDEAVFASPASFDTARTEPGHLAFGHGAHYCVGAPLARQELQVAFAQLTARFPGMRLAVPAAELTVSDGTLLSGLTTLPVTY